METPYCQFHDCYMDFTGDFSIEEGVREEWRCPVGAKMASEEVYQTPTGFPPGCAGISKGGSRD